MRAARSQAKSTSAICVAWIGGLIPCLEGKAYDTGDIGLVTLRRWQRRVWCEKASAAWIAPRRRFALGGGGEGGLIAANVGANVSDAITKPPLRKRDAPKQWISAERPLRRVQDDLGHLNGDNRVIRQCVEILDKFYCR
jgi:hypothetical protein